MTLPRTRIAEHRRVLFWFALLAACVLTGAAVATCSAPDETDAPAAAHSVPAVELRTELVRRVRCTRRHPCRKRRASRSAPRGGAAPTDANFDRLAQCESGGRWNVNTGNGFYGGLQFSATTWHSVGGAGLPHQHSREEQINRGRILQQRSGWGQWPTCSRKLGLR